MPVENQRLIPFNKPYMTGKELWYIAQAHAAGHLAGDGAFTKKCNAWLEQRTEARRALLTHSCTAALEMAAILAGFIQGLAQGKGLGPLGLGSVDGTAIPGGIRLEARAAPTPGAAAGPR